MEIEKIMQGEMTRLERDNISDDSKDAIRKFLSFMKDRNAQCQGIGRFHRLSEGMD